MSTKRNEMIPIIRKRVEKIMGKPQSYMTIRVHHTYEDIYIIELVSGLYQLKGQSLTPINKPSGVYIP